MYFLNLTCKYTEILRPFQNAKYLSKHITGCIEINNGLFKKIVQLNKKKSLKLGKYLD